MMTDMIHFDYRENPVRVIKDENDEPWWVAKDVCGILMGDGVGPSQDTNLN